MRYFELFSLPVQYSVDLAQLNQRYLELQKAVHPDKHAGGSERERLLAVQKTAEINDALQVLKHPLKRAEYMLAERGMDIRAEQQTLQDPAFLMQQMMLREALEEISDAPDVDAAIADFEAQVAQLANTLNAELVAVIDLDDQASLTQAADTVRKLKFVFKLKDELARIEDELFDE